MAFDTNRSRYGNSFGEPTLTCSGAGDAVWSRGNISPYYQKSATGWLADLYGGAQSGSDWAALYIPVNDMDIKRLRDAQWTYYMTNTETMGVNMVIWVHDPADPDNRAEITQLANISGLAKTSGWNSHVLNVSTDQFFFYGEGTTGTALTQGVPNYYGLDDFQADAIFSDWTIYRISLEFGWDASGTFEDAWVADVKINGITIRLKPDKGGSGRIGRRYVTGSSALAHALTPKTPFKVLSANLHVNAAATQENFTITIDAGRAANVYDTNLLTQAMSGVSDVVQTWEGGLDCKADDEIDAAWTNTDARAYGYTINYQTVW